MTTNNDAFGAVIRKLERLQTIDDDDRRMIRSLPFTTKGARAHAYLVKEGQRVATCCILLDGYVCRHKSTSEGGRQIVSFHMPGDIVDAQNLLLSTADHSVQAITDVTYAAVPVAELKEALQARTALGEAIWRDTLIDASVFREWVLNVGRRDAKQRVAHMLCEFAQRRESAGLASPTSFELPMTQADIADATGLTPVHVNRTLALLAQDGSIARDKRHVEIVDWARMKQTADFDAAYLHATAA